MIRLDQNTTETFDGFLSSARARIRRISWRGATVTPHPTGKQRFFTLLSGKAGVMSTGDITSSFTLLAKLPLF